MRKRADAPAVRKGPWHTVRARFRNGAASCRRGRDGSAFIIIIIIIIIFFFFFFFFGERKADAPGSSRHYRRESALSRAAQGAGADTPRRGEGGLCEPLACPGQAVFPHPAPCPGKAAQHGKTPRKKPSPIQGKENAGGCLYILVKFLILIYPWPQQLPVAIGGLSLGRDGAFWGTLFSGKDGERRMRCGRAFAPCMANLAESVSPAAVPGRAFFAAACHDGNTAVMNALSLSLSLSLSL